MMSMDVTSPRKEVVMENVLNSNKTRDRWQVVLVGHIEDVTEAIEALEENLQEAWISFIQEDDGEEATVTITLMWLDQGMTQMVRSIIEADHSHVRIISNGKVQSDDYRDNEPAG